MVIIEKNNILLMPPKTGTSSVLRLKQELKVKTSHLPRYRHSTLSEILHHNEIKNLDDYTVYQLCRHPLDKLVSSYFFSLALPAYRQNHPNLIKLGFKETLKIILPNLHYLKIHPETFNQIINEKTGDIFDHTRPGSKLYTPQTEWNDLNSEITYIKLEDISKNSSILSKVLGKEVNKDLPVVNATHIRRKKPFIEMFDQETLDLAQETYKEDFKILNYEYSTLK